MTLTDRARRSWYLLRFELAMQDYPSKEYKRIRATLRSDLAAAAADVGLRRALVDLGAPSELAAGYYGELHRRRPRYWDGAVAAGLVGAILLYSFLSYGAGAVDTLLASGGGTVELSYLGAAMTVTGTSEQISIESQLSWLGVAVSTGTLAIAFALGARVWRLRAGAVPASVSRDA